MSDAPYKIGRGHPPRDKQFKKGQSGNPAGRRKGARGLRTILAEGLMKEIAAKENGRPIKIPALGAVTRTLVAKAIQGDTKTGLDLIHLGLRIDTDPASSDDEAAPPEDAAIIASAFARRQKVGSDG